jgi:alkanesulfonate monooxygenase SsuD/methylene tetrahydromethanopterin reductase-like flavin-dependent oxidoreductase (luciferase family)
MWTQLVAVASATTRVRLAPIVAQVPLRNPAMFAAQALTADHVSGGRLEIGLGTGLEIDPSYRMMGVPNWSGPERAARVAEYVQIVHRLLTEDEVTFEGRHYRIEQATLRPRPVQHPRPPLMIAALGPVMLRLAARHADIWDTLSFAATFDEQVEEVRGRAAAIDAACATIGRDPATLRRAYHMFDPTARANAGEYSYYRSEEEFERQIGVLTTLGMQEFCLYYPAVSSQLPVFERIARDVLPGLRG